MSTKKSNQPEATGRTFFHVEENGDQVTVQVEGKAGDLINLFANVIDDNADMRRVIEMAIAAVDMKNGEGNPMAGLMAMLSGMGGKGGEA